MRSRDRLTMYCGLAALCVAVLAIGGAVRWAVVLLVLLAALTAASQVRSRRRLDGISPLLIVLSVLSTLTAVQLIPLPPVVLGWLQATPRELVDDGARLLNDPVGWRPLSLDPASTIVELAKFGAYLLLGWMAIRAASSERGRYRLLVGVAGIAAAVAMIGIVHEILGAERLFGLYEPSYAHPIVMAPLLNANHLACLMALGALIAAGLAINEHRAPPVRVLWIIVSIACITVALATRSRGGVIALASGSTVMAGLIVLQRLSAAGKSKRRDVLRIALPAAVVVLCTLVLAVYLGGGEIRNELDSTQLQELSDPRSKYAAWQSALELVEEAPVLGIGRGAFESSFTRVHDQSSHVTFSHAENEYLQVVVDWGVVGALALAVAFGLAAIVALRRWREGVLTACAMGGLTAVGVQSLVDFGLEIPGIALPTILVASTLLHVPLRESSRSSRGFAVRAAIIVAVVIVGLIAGSPRGTSLAEDHAMLDDAELTLPEAAASLRRHPLDYVAATSLSRKAETSQARGAFLNHALRLHPTHFGLHRVVARWLYASGRPSQAALEYRSALLGTEQPEGIVNEVVRTFKTAEEAATAIPPSHPQWGRIVSELIDTKREDVAVAYLINIVDARAERTPDVWRRLYTLAEKRKDLALAERAARGLLKTQPTLPATIQVARVVIARGNYVEALQILTPLASATVSTPDHVDARVLICEVSMLKKEWDAALACLNAMMANTSITPKVRQELHRKLSDTWEALGNKQRAEFERKLAGDR